MKQLMRVFWLIALGSTLWTGVPARASEQVFTVSVAPIFSPSQTFLDWTPFLSKLEKMTGYHFKLLVYEAAPQLEKELGEGVPDLALLNPYLLLAARTRHGYQPLLRDTAPISGILVARKDGSVKTVADLNGKTVAFPAPNALGASLYMRALLSDKMNIKFTPVYVGSHQNVYRHVLLGEAAAGGGIKKTFAKETEALQSAMKVLFSTPEIASHPLAAHPRVDLVARKKIVAAILAMRTDPLSNKLLDAVQMPNPVEANYERDYAGLAQLKLERYYSNQEQ